MNARSALIVAVLLAGAAATASAQGVRNATPRPFRLTASVGAWLAGGYPIGQRAAELRRNSTGTDAPFTLFEAAASFDRTPGVEAHLTFAVTTSVSIEGGVAYSRPRVQIAVTGDVEGANGEFEGETTSEYVVDASVLWRIRGVRPQARLAPFVRAGGGYLRQLHERRTLVETGQVYHVGGGVQYLLRSDPRQRPVGLRGDVRANIRKDGIELEDKARVYPTVSGSAFVRF